MTDNDRMLRYIPKDGEYIEILGHRIDGFDSFQAFCEYLKKFAEMEDTINRQNAEIEELREIVFMDRSEAIKQLKAEAVKEFAEKLKRCMDSYADDWCWIEMSQISFEEMVDLLVKEFRRKKKND